MHYRGQAMVHAFCTKDFPHSIINIYQHGNRMPPPPWDRSTYKWENISSPITCLSHGGIGQDNDRRLLLPKMYSSCLIVDNPICGRKVRWTGHDRSMFGKSAHPHAFSGLDAILQQVVLLRLFFPVLKLKSRYRQIALEEQPQQRHNPARGGCF